MKTSTAFILVAANLLGSAFAFAPTGNHGRTPTTLQSTLPPSSEWKGYYTNYDNSQVVQTDADKGFDPLGFSKTNAGLFFMREAEIKHCRLAM